MLKLKTLKFQNIGRFTSLQTIEFSELTGLIQADAENRNTKGSSGAGKTTVFLALEYLLGLNDIPVTILQSRLTKEALAVEGIFNLDGTELTIVRSKKGLVISTAPETHGSSKLAEEALDKILGMPRDLFRVLMHKRQKEGGFFLNFTPKQTHAFLVDAKKLESHAKKAEEIDADLKKAQELEIIAKVAIESLESGLKSTLEAIAVIGEPPVPSAVTEEHISNLEVIKKGWVDNVNLVEQEHSKQKAELAKEKPVLSVTPFDRSKISAAEFEIQDIQAKLRSMEMLEHTRVTAAKDRLNQVQLKLSTAKSNMWNGERAKTEAQAIVLELKKIKEGHCPTCEQTWVTESIKAKEAQLMQSFETKKAAIILGMESEKEAKLLDEQAYELAKEVAPRAILEKRDFDLQIQSLRYSIEAERKIESEHNSKENQAIKVLNDAYILKLNALSVKMSAELSAIKTQLSMAEQALRDAKQDFESAKAAALRYQTTVNSLSSQKASKEAALASAQATLAVLKDNIEVIAEAKALVKSFISCSFDDALETIGTKATNIIRGVPNMATATIQLEGVRETKEGKIKEEVTAVVHMDGEQSVPIKSLSGGERSAVDLAIDLAVIDFLEDETGKGMDIFILDEPFTGMDAPGVEQILEVLQSSNLNKKIVIVDHNDIVKQFIHNKILVVREGDTSNVVTE